MNCVAAFPKKPLSPLVTMTFYYLPTGYRQEDLLVNFRGGSSPSSLPRHGQFKRSVAGRHDMGDSWLPTIVVLVKLLEGEVEGIW